MPDDQDEDTRAELALVERELAEAAKEADDLRQELGDRSDGVGDPVDRTTLIEQLNVAESLRDDLTRRRDDLRRRIEPADGIDG